MQTSPSAFPATSPYGSIFIVLVPWFLVILAMSYSNMFVPDKLGQPPLLLLLTGVISLAIFTFAYHFVSGFKSFVLSLDMRLLILLHSWRMLGVSFLLFYSVGQLPGVFALPAGIGDAIAAIWAAFLGYRMFTSPATVSRKHISVWNRFGIIDFIIAVTTGVLARESGLLHTPGMVSSDLLSSFPFSIIPAFLVQVFMLSHIIIYLQLKNHPAR